MTTPSSSIFRYRFKIIFTLFFITLLRLPQLDHRLLRSQDHHWWSWPAFSGTLSATYVHDGTGIRRELHKKNNSNILTETVKPKLEEQEMVLIVQGTDLVSSHLLRPVKHGLQIAAAVFVWSYFSSSSTRQPRILVTAFIGSDYSAAPFIPWKQSIQYKSLQQVTSMLQSLPFYNSFSTLKLAINMCHRVLYIYMPNTPRIYWIMPVSFRFIPPMSGYPSRIVCFSQPSHILCSYCYHRCGKNENYYWYHCWQCC